MGWDKEERPGMLPHPASHSQVTHYGARVAPQRCPILRRGGFIILRDIRRAKRLTLLGPPLACGCQLSIPLGEDQGRLDA